MPTPLGHAIAGAAAGWAVAAPTADRRGRLVQAAILAGLAMAPDLDLLVGRHSGVTHSLGAAALAATVAAWWRWPLADRRWQIWLAAWVAWSTHPLLDALSPDHSAPIGVMAFWPLSHSYFQTGLAVFAPIWRDPLTANAIRHDIAATTREVLILAPIAWAIWTWRAGVSRRTRRSLARSSGRAGPLRPSARAEDTADISDRPARRAEPAELPGRHRDQ